MAQAASLRRAFRLSAAAVTGAMLAAGATDAHACATCKGLVDGPGGESIGAAFSASIFVMLTSLFGLVAGGGLAVMRVADPAGYARLVQAARTSAGRPRTWAAGACAAGAIAFGAAGAAEMIGAGNPGPPDVLPWQALAGRQVVQPGESQPRALPDAEPRSVVVVTFFATWCMPCREQLGDLSRLASELGADVSVIALNHLEANPDAPGYAHTHADGSVHVHSAPGPAQLLPDWLRATGLDLPVALADRTVAAAFGGVDRLPTTFVFDPTGRLSQVYVNEPTGPFVKPDFAHLRRDVAAALAGVPRQEAAAQRRPLND